MYRVSYQYNKIDYCDIIPLSCFARWCLGDVVGLFT